MVRPSPRGLLLFRIGATLVIVGILGAIWSSEPWQLRLSVLTVIAGLAVFIAGSRRTQADLHREQQAHLGAD